jgi:hypothetical protein
VVTVDLNMSADLHGDMNSNSHLYHHHSSNVTTAHLRWPLVSD